MSQRGVSAAKKSLRGVASAKKKKSLRSDQGSELPEDGSPIEAYPIKCCVLVEVAGDLVWHMIVFRIGDRGAPHLARLGDLPDTLRWNAGMGEARIAAPGTIVVRSCWPLRSSTGLGEGGEGGDSDPLALTMPVDGSLMASHLRDVRPADDAPPPRKS